VIRRSLKAAQPEDPGAHCRYHHESMMSSMPSPLRRENLGAAAVAEFDLSDEQRHRLVVQERQ
jgi:hypothetical protein